MKLTIRVLFFIACGGFGIYTIVRAVSPLLSLRTWLEIVLGFVLAFMVYLVDAVRRMYERRLGRWQQSAENIEKLTLALGVCYLAYNQLESEEVLSKAMFQSVKDRIAEAFDRYFHDPKQTDVLYDEARLIPASVADQKQWVDSQCVKLRRLIEVERSTQPLGSNLIASSPAPQ